MTPPLYSLLAFAAWTLGLVVFGIGTTRIGKILRGQAAPSAFRADVPHGSERYRRLLRAHANCVENLGLFAVLVLVAHIVGERSVTFDSLAVAVVVARVGQSLVHIASGSNLAVNVRFTFFVAQIVSFIWMGALVASPPP